MGLLVAGFIVSALTTRSGVPVAGYSAESAASSAYLAVAGRTPTDSDRPDADRHSPLEVEVLNGCGVPGLALRFTNYLRSQGYDVVHFSDADSYDYPRTLVINRGTDPDRALQVARSLSLDPAALENRPDSALQLDVTVILGHDYLALDTYRVIMARR